MRNIWLSPSYQDTDFPFPHSLDTKIALFEDRALGWKLDIADQLIMAVKISRQFDIQDMRPWILFLVILR